MDYITKTANELELLARVRSALQLKHEMDARKEHARALADLNHRNGRMGHFSWNSFDSLVYNADVVL